MTNKYNGLSMCQGDSMSWFQNGLAKPIRHWKIKADDKKNIIISFSNSFSSSSLVCWHEKSKRLCSIQHTITYNLPHCSAALLWYLTVLSIQSMNSFRLPLFLHVCAGRGGCNCPFHWPLLVIKQHEDLSACRRGKWLTPLALDPASVSHCDLCDLLAGPHWQGPSSEL